MPDLQSPDATTLEFDAFLTYASADRAAVRRIQAFLESFRPPGSPRRLKVYLDETDMRGGSLPDNLFEALAGSGALVVCWSDRTAASDWVAKEIAQFCALGRQARIAVVHVGGAEPKANHPALRELEPLEHDLRNAWWAWFLKPASRLELLRLLAFLTNVEMRVLRDWARRRLIRSVAMGALPAVVIAAALTVTLLLPQTEWQAVRLTSEGQPIEAVACEVVDGRLWLASWYEGAGEISGTRAYFEAYPDALATQITKQPQPRFTLPKRALTEDLADDGLVSRVRAAFSTPEIARSIRFGDGTRYAEPSPGRFVFIQPIRYEATPEEEKYSARDRLPVPETNGTLVAVLEAGHAPKIGVVESMSPPRWNPRTDDNRRRRSPARAMSVVWHNREIWIGAAGERQIAGGLWHSPDAGSTWQKVDGFSSVTSIDLELSPSGSQLLRVAEQGGLSRLTELEFKEGESKVMERRGDGSFAEAAAPPHGSASEIEICGRVPGDALYYRVDNRIFKPQTRRLFQTIF